jgi:hypothetical protein
MPWYFYGMIGIILIIIFGSLLAWLLAGPVILLVDTERGDYRLALPGIISVALLPSGELFSMRVRIFFIPLRFNPFSPGKAWGGKKGGKEEEKPGKGDKKGEEPSKRKRKSSFLKMRKGTFRMGRDVLRAIRIRRLRLDLDTDDFILNAWLVPAFTMVNGGNIRMTVNFEGRASLLLDLRTRLGSLAWIFIKNQYKSMFIR